MHRTQIYLPDQLHKRLKARARRQGVTVSEVIRQAIDQPAQPRQRLTGRHLIKELVALTDRAGWTRLPTDLAQHVDEVVYGQSAPLRRRAARRR